MAAIAVDSGVRVDVMCLIHLICACQETWMHQRQGLSVCEMSRCLIIHCHGGGFVAQSSASHQVALMIIPIHTFSFQSVSVHRETEKLPTRN